MRGSVFDILSLAVDEGGIDAVYRILSLIEDPSIQDNAAIRWAAQHGQVGVVELLLSDPRVDPTAKNNNAIRWAADNGHVKVVELLLQDGRVDPTDHDNFAIRSAAQNEHIDVVKLLLQDPRVREVGVSEDSYSRYWTISTYAKLIILLEKIDHATTRKNLQQLDTIPEIVVDVIMSYII